METHFASPERATPGELYRDIHEASSNPIVDGLLKTVGGLIAVLNEHRQILAVNNALLDMIGIEDPRSLLGLRPGEAIGCIHAHEMPGGCGTSRYCSTCGAAIAIVTSLSSNGPQEQKCVATVSKDGKQIDLCLRVRACPIFLEGTRFVLLFIQNITLEESWAALEWAFFHDISSTITAIRRASELMEFRDGEGKNRLARQIRQMSHHLTKEVDIQRALSQPGQQTYTSEAQDFTTHDVLRELQTIFAGHSAAKNKILFFPENIPCVLIKSDLHLVLRVITNMLTNAFEATPEGGTVKIWAGHDQDLTFHVWSRQVISDDVARRVFQRHYSTKGDRGRGIGTYAMKLFGEGVLGGKVDFTTSEADGTTFRLSLPLPNKSC
ncbi:MAG: HAMP domain-containing histidine kinase [Nitrospirae bacterium]|nr:HAMP domain-containing histidine kinase [Nitrospirota bacterium]